MQHSTAHSTQHSTAPHHTIQYNTTEHIHIRLRFYCHIVVQSVSESYPCSQPSIHSHNVAKQKIQFFPIFFFQLEFLVPGMRHNNTKDFFSYFLFSLLLLLYPPLENKKNKTKTKYYKNNIVSRIRNKILFSVRCINPATLIGLCCCCCWERSMQTVNAFFSFFLHCLAWIPI